MPTLMFCKSCNKWVVFGDANRGHYSEFQYILGGVTVNSKCPVCKGTLDMKK